jgi:DNA-directed RNA polymerase III subunit RPC3
MRLRRQHEVDVGKEWIERAKEAGSTDVNENEIDKTNYNKFCQGLERLDNAILQLDETLMALVDF